MVIFDIRIARRLRLRRMLFIVCMHTSKCTAVQAIRRVPTYTTCVSVMRYSAGSRQCHLSNMV